MPHVERVLTGISRALLLFRIQHTCICVAKNEYVDFAVVIEQALEQSKPACTLRPIKEVLRLRPCTSFVSGVARLHRLLPVVASHRKCNDAAIRQCERLIHIFPECIMGLGCRRKLGYSFRCLKIPRCGPAWHECCETNNSDQRCLRLRNACHSGQLAETSAATRRNSKPASDWSAVVCRRR